MLGTALAVLLATGFNAVAEDLIYSTKSATLVIGLDGKVRSLLQKYSGKELLKRNDRAFSAAVRSGQVFPASTVRRQGDHVLVTFGSSGITAEFRFGETPEYLIVELLGFHGNGVEEIRLMQLDLSLPHRGSDLGVLWDDDFAVGLFGLSDDIHTEISGRKIAASTYSQFHPQNGRVVMIAAPTSVFLALVQGVEHTFRLPSPTLGGSWAKLSPDVRTSYLFTDLTEANVDEMIRYAKMAGARYVLIYSGVWSASLGSYPINQRNYPGGEAGLTAVIGKCHAAGLKVGMHMLTSFVSKNDPLVSPKPTPWLHKDAQATLSAAVDDMISELSASDLAGFSVKPGGYGPAADILIDDEIIQYRQLEGVTLRQCKRGFAGTTASAHKAGAKIYHLTEREGSYVADPRTPLKDAISDRISGLINRCGFDMIYFDGGEINSVVEPGWYWMSQQQMQIWEKSKRDLLVQGSGITDWSWHIFARGTSDDGAAVAVKPYFDLHKIADYWTGHRNDFLPAELGWVGLFTDAPDRPATMPDEVEFYAARMLALDSPISFETSLSALKANGRTEEMLRMLGRYEHLRLSNSVPVTVREKLRSGEWHMTRPGEFHPVHYDAQRLSLPGELAVQNGFQKQALKFRLQVAPVLTAPGDRSNVPLLRAEPALDLPAPDGRAVLPGALIHHFDLTGAAQRPVPGVFTGPDDRGGHPLDLRTHRALALRLTVDGVTAGSGESAVLNIQLETSGKAYRDYYVDLDFRGQKTIVLTEPGTGRTLAEFRPASVNYPFKAAMGGFDYGDVVGLNLRWMRYPKGVSLRCGISLIEGLLERESKLRDVRLSLGASSLVIPGEMKTGDYAEYWAEGVLRIYNRNGLQLFESSMREGPQLGAGQNKLDVSAWGEGAVVFTTITTGK